MNTRYAKALAIFALYAALPSCQPPPEKVLAVFEDGKLVFHARTPGLFVDRIFGWDDARVHFLSFAVSDGKDPIWQIERDLSMPNCSSDNEFPLAYGAERCGFVKIVEAGPLRPGNVYSIRMVPYDLRHSDLDYAYAELAGCFRIDATSNIENMSTDYGAHNACTQQA